MITVIRNRGQRATLLQIATNAKNFNMYHRVRGILDIPNVEEISSQFLLTDENCHS